jgi:hypothetical protein
MARFEFVTVEKTYPNIFSRGSVQICRKCVTYLNLDGVIFKIYVFLFFKFSRFQLNKLTVKDESDTNTYKLIITSTDPRRSNVSITLIAQSVDQHKNWLEKIEQILEDQRNFLRLLVKPPK